MISPFIQMQDIPGGAYAVLESITDAFFALNRDWEFTYANHQTEVVLGYQRSELIGKTLWQIYPTLVDSEFDRQYREAVRTQQATSFTSYFPAHDRWYEVHAYPSDIGLSIYFRNVTERIRSEEKLRQSELRFRLMADSIPQMVWIADAAGRAEFFNRQWSAYTGNSAGANGEDIAMHCVHPEDRVATADAWSTARRDKGTFSVEHRLLSASGEYRWFLVRAEPEIDSGTGDIVRWFGTSTDVHASKLNEVALRASEARYRSLFESIDEGFCIIQMLYDADGAPCDYRFCEINPMFEKQSGLSNALGTTALAHHPQLEKHWFELYGNVATTGIPVRYTNEAKTMNRWFDVYAFRIGDPAERKVAVLFKDVSQQRMAEENMRRSELQAHRAARQAEAERYRLDAVLEAVPVGIVVSDAGGSIQLSNAANRKLWGEQHPLARRLSELNDWKGWWADGSAKHGQRLQPEEWTASRILRGEDALQDVIEIESFDDVPVRRTVFNSGAPVRDKDGAITGAVVAQMDITDRVRAEEGLRLADRRKDEFLAMLAHELRNPLAPIASAADLLALSGLDAARVKQTSAIISRQVRHMTGLVNDLLDVSRVTRGLVTLRREKLDAKRIVADAVEQVRPLIETRKHRLTVHTPAESAFVMGDQKRLVQAMTNLLNNAAKYTREGGDIVLTMAVDGDYVQMAVADNGNGMSAELVARAFELFAQAERSSDRSQGGLGIGLALVKSLVELHGGTVIARSDGLGLGSRFTICLPHLDEPEDQPSRGVEPAEAPPSGTGLRIMIVDDNADAAQMLALYLETAGHQVCVEHSSLRALERAAEARPDVCLLDIGLPDLDGNELARRLRAQPETVDAVLIAITGYGQEQDRTSALAAGFDRHFIKPVDIAALSALLAELARSRSSPP